MIAIDYEAPNAPADAIIDVAIVEHSTSTNVRAGENAGRVLHHTNVVRAFVAARVERTASIVARVPVSLRRQDGEVIAYVQRPLGQGGMAVLGAARETLPR